MDDLKESMKGGLYKAMARNIVFILTAIVLVTIWSFGCGPRRPTLQERRLEILDSGKKARDKASRKADDFFNCMIRYTQENSQVSATASEIAEAALSTCKFDLDLYKMNMSGYYFCMDGVNVTSIESLDWVRDKADEKARVDAQDLAQHVKGLVINRLIKMRQ